MATKSVIEIDVLDEKFQAFVKEFDKYKSAIAKMPADWGKVGASLVELDKKQKDFNKSVKNGSQSLKEAASHTASIAKNLASSVVSIGKWMALGATVGGFGLGGLASSASDYRKRAQGLGVTTGQIRAAEISLGRYIDPQSALTNISNIQSDLNRAPILGRLGAQQGMNAAENLPNIIRQSVAMFKQGGGTKQYAEAMGLTDVFSMEELRRLSSLSREELEKTIESYKKAQKSLDVSDKSSRSWQDFWFKIKEAGQVIETALIDKLVALAPKLIEFSNAITSLLLKFIDAFGNYLGTEKFQQDAKSLGELFKNLSIKLVEAANFLGLIHLSKDQKQRLEDEKKIIGGQGVEGKLIRNNKISESQLDERRRIAVSTFMGLGYDKDQAIGATANLEAESGLREGAQNSQGNYGIAQWDTNRRKLFEKVMGKSIVGSSFFDQLRFSAYEMQNTEAAAGASLRNAVGLKSSVSSFANDYERFRSKGMTESEYQKEIDRRTGIASQISVRIDNATGGNAIATVNSMK